VGYSTLALVLGSGGPVCHFDRDVYQISQIDEILIDAKD
jgi:hypothetical protein